MKSLFILFLFSFSTISLAQNTSLIHNILVPGTYRPTLQQALDEFWWYAQNKNYLIADENFIETYFTDLDCGCNVVVDWPNSMLAFKGYTAYHPNHGWQAIKWTGLQIGSYAIVYRFENNSSRKLLYEERAKKGAEFLLWAQDYFDLHGAFLSKLCCDNPIASLLDMASAGNGLLEMYRTFGDSNYFTAAKSIADYIYQYPPYPHLWHNDPYRYYGNPNHLGECLNFLSNFYQLTGKQTYLDLALQIAEELFAWQDYKHINDPWHESGTTNGDWDGGWYWYIYAPNPLPPGCIPNGNPA